jgi:hypothetical protein
VLCIPKKAIRAHARTHTNCVILIAFHGNKDFVNEPQLYVHCLPCFYFNGLCIPLKFEEYFQEVETPDGMENILCR